MITIGSRGDVQPYLALGTGFKRAGYEVRLLTHGAFAGAAREARVDFIDLGVDPRTVCHITGYWFLDTKADWTPPSALETFLQAGPKPVYIGFGSMRGADERGFTEQVVSALQLCEQRGILLTGWGALAHVPFFLDCAGLFSRPRSREQAMEGELYTTVSVTGTVRAPPELRLMVILSV